MTPSKKFAITKLGLKDPEDVASVSEPTLTHEEKQPSFLLKKSTLGGIALGGAFMFSPIEELVAQSTQKVNRYSGPSDLKITDMRYCIIQNVGRTPIIRIDTNQESMVWEK